MCEDATKQEKEEEYVPPRKRSPSPRRRSLSPPPYPGAKPITAGLYLEPHHLHGKLYNLHHSVQIPVYFFKWFLSQLLAVYSILFWSKPGQDDDIIRLCEESSIITVLRRDHEAERLEKEAFHSLRGCSTANTQSLLETRHYYVNVKRCEIDLHMRPRGADFKSGGVHSIPLKSWSMRYTKTQRKEGGSADSSVQGQGGKNADRSTRYSPWTNRILSFVVNGQTVYEREKMLAFLFHYNSGGSHTKVHLMGNSLADRIVLDDRVRDKLAESTWTTTALHYGLLYGTQGPMTETRNEGNKWMGIGSVVTRESLVKESENMSALGADHADKQRWADLELPFSDFLLGARLALTRAMKKNDIPSDLHEAIFLSCIMHACDHIQLFRLCWGKNFNFDVRKPGNWYDHYESTVWRYMWVEPTLNPFWNNKIRSIRKPFYQQLHKGLKEIDTFDVADYITASIMY